MYCFPESECVGQVSLLQGVVVLMGSLVWEAVEGEFPVDCEVLLFICFSEQGIFHFYTSVQKATSSFFWIYQDLKWMGSFQLKF